MDKGILAFFLTTCAASGALLEASRKRCTTPRMQEPSPTLLLSSS